MSLGLWMIIFVYLTSFGSKNRITGAGYFELLGTLSRKGKNNFFKNQKYYLFLFVC